MNQTLLFNLSALVALLPASLVGFRKEADKDSVYWWMLAVAIAGPLVWVFVQMSGTWRTGLSMALWVTISVTMILFGLTVALARESWRLTPLLAPYLFVVGILAVVWQQAPGKALAETAPGIWVGVHIVLSVATYGLVTIAAVAALGAFLQERALKAKNPTALTRRLPSVADCEFLVVRLLAIAEGILAFGLATGMATQYAEAGTLLVFDHKTVLAFTAFLVIGGLLFAHFRTGVRGRVAARIVLVVYLLMTLGYPGVKFVTDVLLTR